MKDLIVTINCWRGDIERWSKTSNSIESIRQAAQRWGADYFEHSTIKYAEYNPPGGIRKAGGTGGWNGFLTTFLWQKIWIIENFTNYDRVLIIDTDTIINSKAPSIFEELGNSDMAAVLDGNPGRMPQSGDYFRHTFAYNNSRMGGELDIFKAIPGFNEKDYWENYFNAGVMVYNAKVMGLRIEGLKDLMLNSPHIKHYLEHVDAPVDQSLLNAWVSTDGLDLKFLDNTWNWLAPDTWEEYNGMWAGPMQPNIYHFCGANLTKERCETYDRWK